jgi:hypothetical protein
MKQITMLLLIPLLTGACGIVAAFFTGRAPMSGRVALGLLLLPTLSVASLGFDWPEQVRDPLAWGVFAFTVPICLTYSFHARRRAPDRRLALAGFAGAVLFSLPYIIMMPQIVFLFVRDVIGLGASSH